MRYIIFYFLSVLSLYANLIKTPLLAVDGEEGTISLEGISVGMSGFVVHQLSADHSIIVNSVEVIEVDKTTNQATLQLSKFTMFKNNNLPSLKYTAQKGDEVILAFGYNRGLLIAPNEQIYYTLKNAMRGEVLAHPDLFTAFLSTQGHPSPLKEDFTTFCNNLSIGLLFFYIEQNLYTVDCNSFAILDVQKAPLEEKKTQTPFYTRIKHIEANWFGEGSNEMKQYAPYYKKLLLQSYPRNSEKLIQVQQESVTISPKQTDTNSTMIQGQ